MKAYCGGGIAPHILNLGIRWSWVLNFTPRPLCLWYLLGKRLGGPWRWRRENCHPLLGMEHSHCTDCKYHVLTQQCVSVVVQVAVTACGPVCWNL